MLNLIAPSRRIAQPPAHNPVAALLKLNEERPVYVPDSLLRGVYYEWLTGRMLFSCAYAPLILALVGPSGSGKSATANEVFDRLNFRVQRLHASLLEHPDAGMPARRVLGAYLEASKKQATERRPHVLLIDDVDMGLGAGRFLANASGTTNLAQVLSAFMELADRPTMVNGEACEPVRICVTANNLTLLHEPLIRAGRMTMIHWDPKGAELDAIVSHIFRNCLSGEQIALLRSKTPTWRVAEYRSLRHVLHRGLLAAMYDGVPATQMLANVLKNPRFAPDPAELPKAWREVDLGTGIEAVNAQQAAKINYLQEAPATA